MEKKQTVFITNGNSISSNLDDVTVIRQLNLEDKTVKSYITEKEENGYPKGTWMIESIDSITLKTF